MWVIITENKKGYSLHPETRRWKGKLKDMYFRHEELVSEMIKRGYNHHSSLEKRKATGKSKQDVFVDVPSRQIQILKDKKCDCKI
ncbi:pyrimidine dimer DNA glycosylase [Nitrosarchaeum sp.]|nr:pyrimidine dimer DNA glycosylase [Nitrosarchaeum sp.]